MVKDPEPDIFPEIDVFGTTKLQLAPVAKVMFFVRPTLLGRLNVADLPLLPKIIGSALFPKTPFAELLFTPVTASVPSKIWHWPV